MSCSAYADGVAKEYLSEEMDDAGREQLRQVYIGERVGRKVMYEVGGGAEDEDGGWAPYDGKVFDAAKERAGWWVQRRELERVSRASGAEGGVILEESKVGRRAVNGNGTYWEGVMRKTGKSTVPDAMDAMAKPGVEHREEAKTDNCRRGVAASMRNGGEAARVTHGRWWREAAGREEERGEWGKARRCGEQGCTACCGRKQWWRWDQVGGAPRWVRAAGETATKADTWHVLEARCRGVKSAKGIAGDMVRLIQNMRWLVSKEEKGGAVGGAGGRRKGGARRQPRPGMEEVAEMMDEARKLMKGEWGEEGERMQQRWAMRRLLAGALPAAPGEEVGEAEGLKMAKQVAEKVKELQRCAAKLLAEWEEAGRAEKMARAAREEKMETLRAGFAVMMRGLRAMGEAREREKAAGEERQGDGGAAGGEERCGECSGQEGSCGRPQEMEEEEYDQDWELEYEEELAMEAAEEEAREGERNEGPGGGDDAGEGAGGEQANEEAGEAAIGAADGGAVEEGGALAAGRAVSGATGAEATQGQTTGEATGGATGQRRRDGRAGWK